MKLLIPLVFTLKVVVLLEPKKVMQSRALDSDLFYGQRDSSDVNDGVSVTSATIATSSPSPYAYNEATVAIQTITTIHWGIQDASIQPDYLCNIIIK